MAADKTSSARAEADAPDGVLVVPLVTEAGTVEIHVPPAGKWKARSQRRLREGDFDSWAEMVLSDDDYDLWLDADPTNDEVEAFFEAMRDAGQDMGKSSASRRSLRSTARR